MEVDLEMASRIAQIMEYKTGGKATVFAEYMGWSKQYVNKLLKGESVGIKVVTAIAKKMPEINTRWLLLGEGNMIELSFGRVFKTMLDLERFIPAMNQDELERLSTGRLNPTEFDLARWNTRINEIEQSIQARFAKAYENSIQ